MNLFISFSGGRTSAYMTKWLLENVKDVYEEVVVLFANTGQENEATLEFVDRCDKEFNFGLIWVEALVDPKVGNGVRHKIVNFETASRKGVPFEDMIRKYGIPNVTGPFCTRSLKLHPMTSYIRSIGWKNGNYETAVGIRIDEMDRVSSQMNENQIIYPLVEMKKMSKEAIILWWRDQSFDLQLREHEGNCSWCWKKSKRKLLTLAVDSPEIFEFPKRMELLYPRAGRHMKDEDRVFFRGRMSTNDMMKEAALKEFIPWTDKVVTMDHFDYDEDLDLPNGCSESCEVY